MKRPAAAIAAATALVLTSLVAPAAAEEDPGLEWARAEVKRSPPPDDVEALYWPARGAPRVLRTCRGACRRSWHLAAGALPPEDLAKRPVYKVTPVPAQLAAAPAGAPAGEIERPPAAAAGAPDLDAVVRAYATAVPASATGAAQSLTAAGLADEALRAAGQVVVDRASSAALERVRDKIADGLRCAEPGAPRTGRFDRTCRVVASLRVQDLAQHGQVLFNALLYDATAQALPALSGGARPPVDLLTRVLLPEVPRLLDGHVGRGAEVVASRLVEASLAELRREGVREWLRASSRGAARGRAAVALASLAYAQCGLAASQGGGAAPLAACPVDDFVRRTAAGGTVDDPSVLTQAHELARLLLDAVTLQAEGGGAWRERASSAAAAAFTVACLNVDASPELRGCPAAYTIGASPTTLERLGLARFLVNAALDGDPNAVVVAAIAAADASAPGAVDRRARRALRLVGALLQATRADAGQKVDPRGAAERRARLLEDLSAEMSNRAERAGDAIWSLGGSLRLAGGARFGVESDRTTFYGPLGLPLGLGLQTVAESGFGLHFELSAFDLGQYLTFEDGGKVRKPRAADALAPSMTLGAAFGKNVPFLIGPTLGYSPQFMFADGKRGSVNFGVAFGLYVPILDLNLGRVAPYKY
jgi:hypothetical protein